MQKADWGMEIRHQQAHQAASMYYLQGMTMEAVARQLGVSRSSVSRLLSFARDQGIVKIRVNAPTGERGTIAGEIERQFGVKTWVVPTLDVDSPPTRLRAVAVVAARRLSELLEPDMTLGMAWGNTISAVVAELAHDPKPGTRVVQLNGAANALDSGLLYADSIISAAASAFGSRAIHFPVPAFFDYQETKEALWKERSIRSVLEAIDSCDIVTFGVGSMDPTMPSHVYAGGYLDAAELERARADGVVGDVCTVLIREDGSTDMELNARASGPPPSQLQRIPIRLCVVSGAAKAPALLGTLRAGAVTDLIVDSSAAREVLRLSSPRKGGYVRFPII